MTVPLSNLTATWNAGATVFSAIKMNVTNTASAATSKLIDMQIGGTPAFVAGIKTFTNQPWIAAGTGIPSQPLSVISAGTSLGEKVAAYDDGGGCYGLGVQANRLQFLVPSTTNDFEFVQGASASATQSARLSVDANHILAQRNSTNPQSLRVYNTYTDASNYERFTADWNTTSNVCYVRNEAAGTGTARLCIYRSGATTVSSLPSASTAGAGARCFVTDATVTTFASTVAGGGSNKVPVVSDGTNWLIG